MRDNLNFHDGSPVTTDEVVCSLERNMEGRSVLGKLLKVDLDRMEKVNDKTFTISLTNTFGLVLDALAENAVGSAIIYTMDDCVVDPLEAADVKIGNGPMKFIEWNPGSDALYRRNEEYVPRSEPVSDYAGGKIIYIDELKYQIIPDRNTRAIALETGLVDMIDFPLEDDFARLAPNEDLANRPAPGRRCRSKLPDAPGESRHCRDWRRCGMERMARLLEARPWQALPDP